jgi:hypothetical protein
VHHNFAEWVPCLGVLHVVCMSKAILVPLLLASAYSAHVPIFDVEAASVAHILVCVPLYFVCIYFAGGMLSLLHSSLNVWDKLCTLDIQYGQLWTASTMCASASAATASTAASRRASMPSRLLGHIVVPSLIVGLCWVLVDLWCGVCALLRFHCCP